MIVDSWLSIVGVYFGNWLCFSKYCLIFSPYGAKYCSSCWKKRTETEFAIFSDIRKQSIEVEYRANFWIFGRHTGVYWLVLQVVRFIRSRLSNRYISTFLLARISWLVVQIFSGFVEYCASAGDDEKTDGEILGVIWEYIHHILGDDADFEDFRGQLFRPYGGKHFGRKSYPVLDKYLTSSVLNHYPRLPARRAINQLSGIITLRDCFEHGYFLNIRDMWELIKNGEKVELKHHIPRTVALQFRIMSLFCTGRPEDMLSICIIFCWERLGRLLLKKCKSTSGLTDIFDTLIKELRDDQSGAC